MEMSDLEKEAFLILIGGEPLPVDLYIHLNNSGINADDLIMRFKLNSNRKEQTELNLNLN
tara:strand:- start:310 stop:489 length:180 start_codon:yes stop_codon:yes gene_type:complete